MHTNFCLTCHTGDIRSAKELLDELQEVTDWMPFGLYLGLTVPTLKQIQKDQQTTDRCRREMLLTWGKEQTPTWLKVIQALVKIRMFHLAVKIASKYGKLSVQSKCKRWSQCLYAMYVCIEEMPSLFYSRMVYPN